jgi:hypothetical protein
MKLLNLLQLLILGASVGVSTIGSTIEVAAVIFIIKLTEQTQHIFLVIFKIMLMPSTDAQFQNQTISVNFLQGFMKELIALLSKKVSNIFVLLISSPFSCFSFFL